MDIEEDLEEFPNIHELFQAYNALYFGVRYIAPGLLGSSCLVSLRMLHASYAQLP